MSFDTKYRPPTYDGVLGQEGTVKILRQFVKTGKARQQSYLFAGPFGSGKTTLGRILARALLCESPTETGDPCDQCVSCRSLLTVGTAEGYVEVDAATNSGKDQMRKVVEEIQFSTFSGRHRVYLFDEAHQLTRDALDAILKPLEDNLPGSSDKQLVCIFCTTEPEKMRATILSRCAPAFVVRPVAPEKIAARLAFICEKEGIPFDPEVLPLIASTTECHIRDALKALEGIAMLGEVNRANVETYLHHDLNTFYLEILENLGGDPAKVFGALTTLLERRSPASCYEKLSELALRAYLVGLDAVKVEVFWDIARLKALAARHGSSLLALAAVFADRPAKPTAGALKLDLLKGHVPLSFGATGLVASPAAMTPVLAALPPVPNHPPPQANPAPAPPTASAVSSPASVVEQRKPASGTLEQKVDYGESEFRFPEAAKKRQPPPGTPEASPEVGVSEFGVEDFCWLLARRVRELSEGGIGSARRSNVGGP